MEPVLWEESVHFIFHFCLFSCTEPLYVLLFLLLPEYLAERHPYYRVGQEEEKESIYQEQKCLEKGIISEEEI